jgi:hypothetical protein
MEPQAVEVFLGAQARKLREDLATIRSDHLREYDLTDVTVQVIFNETRSALKPPTRVPGSIERIGSNRGQGRAGKGTRSLRIHGAATNIRQDGQDYTLRCISKSVRDRSGTPPLVAPGEIDVLDHSPKRSGASIWHTNKRDL